MIKKPKHIKIDERNHVEKAVASVHEDCVLLVPVRSMGAQVEQQVGHET